VHNAQGTAQVKVTPAQARDLLPIVELLADCGLPSQDITQSHLDHFWVVRDGLRLAGVVGLELCGRFALLRSLAVSVEQRGQGIGTRLVTQAEACARSRGVCVIYLLTATARSFFAGRGYRLTERHRVPAEIQRTAEFRAICPSSAICLSKELDSPSPAAGLPGAV
jgi:amino-acid N-acetyltransferase